jgi:signal transduction histidine kinase
MLLLENNSINELTLKNCRKHLQYAIEEVRNISHRLSSDKIQKQGFKRCFEQIIKTINDSEALVIHFEMDSNVDIDILDSTLLNNLLRVFQEHLNNIIKHADASSVSINITFSMNSLEVEIRDNGKGFNMRDVVLGLGLQNIYERVELFGGKAIFDTSPGHGCTLSLCIPVLYSIGKTGIG